ncbi:hypothetical protein BDV96DRAFT_106776 [Lophiotrema nucula]|uniref:Uncharacterized protein n=1 Tax=Lophiotrema nucula TaxID=690887 RepID=A0A6A5Z6N9_9PLEO|nr:hypothetical protein BDV96DRAFT_106776 [Lophiotrema nucula]
MSLPEIFSLTDCSDFDTVGSFPSAESLVISARGLMKEEMLGFVQSDHRQLTYTLLHDYSWSDTEGASRDGNDRCNSVGRSNPRLQALIFSKWPFLSFQPISSAPTTSTQLAGKYCGGWLTSADTGVYEERNYVLFLPCLREQVLLMVRQLLPEGSCYNVLYSGTPFVHAVLGKRDT